MPIQIISPFRKGLPVEVHVTFHQTTLEELRFQLFSLTDIPPQHILLRTSTRTFPPHDETDSLKTLSSIGINPSSTLFYENIDDTSTDSLAKPPISPPSAHTSISLSNLKDALASVSIRRTPQRKPEASSSAAVSRNIPSSPNLPSLSPPQRRNLTSFINTVYSYHKSALRYEDPALYTKALKVVPAQSIREAAENLHREDAKKYPTYDMALAKQLLIWFKESFFTWVNSPKCWSCGSDMSMIGMVAPTEREASHDASRVEFYQCQKCSGTTRFPRYNDVAKLLETRKGRCGEWAQAFTLIVRAMGLRARVVHDWTDHVWTEIYCGTEAGQGEGRWIHADSCENVLDEPLLYEKGWGKKLNYCIATGKDCVMDVSRRYTESFESLRGRRDLVDEEHLGFELDKMNGKIVEALPISDRDEAMDRYFRDIAQMGQAGEKSEELPGRESGSAAWVKSRGEDGSSR